MVFGDWIGQLVIAFSAFVGVAALVAAIVSALKVLAHLPDGEAEKASNIINFALFAVFVVVVGVIGIPVPPGLDELAGRLATVIMAVLGLFTQLKASPVAYKVFKFFRLPVVGFSYSALYR